MTTATPRTRRPRAMKIFAAESALSIVPVYVGDAIGLGHRIQAPYYVAAPTKKAAVELLAAAGFGASARELRVATGNDLMAALDAGLLTEEGEIISWAEYSSGDRPVVRIAPGTREPVRVGHWEYFERIDGVRVQKQLLVRESDGSLFPPRWDSKPATPPTGWTPEMEK